MTNTVIDSYMNIYAYHKDAFTIVKIQCNVSDTLTKV